MCVLTASTRAAALTFASTFASTTATAPIIGTSLPLRTARHHRIRSLRYPNTVEEVADPVVGALTVAVGFLYCAQHPLTTFWLLLVFVSTVHLARYERLSAAAATCTVGYFSSRVHGQDRTGQNAPSFYFRLKYGRLAYDQTIKCFYATFLVYSNFKVSAPFLIFVYRSCRRVRLYGVLDNFQNT
jgi:hypothetical protein